VPSAATLPGRSMLERVLFVHNTYQHPGGEDSVVAAEMEMLRARGHAVDLYCRDNDEILETPKIKVSRDTFWSRRTTRDLVTRLRTERPDIVHVHNTFPLISPAVYWAAKRIGVPVVQTLHNFRLLCLQAMLLRAGRICEDCLGRSVWRGVPRRCYRDSFPGSGVVAGMLTLHRIIGTYKDKVDRYIALNEFCRKKFIDGGLPAARISVKPNFVARTMPRPLRPREGVIFVGRLSPEKGIATLADASRQLPNVKFSVFGTGPEEPALRYRKNVALQGFQDTGAVRNAMDTATCLVIPSLCYESFPMTLLEAFSCSLPVIASDRGPLRELIRDGHNGLLFEPGNASDLAEKLRWADENPEGMRHMGTAARAIYEANYTPDTNYRQLIEIYKDCIGASRMLRSAGPADID
jgi:glycosyltransferase involved in cell wall biosynthesis